MGSGELSNDIVGISRMFMVPAARAAIIKLRMFPSPSLPPLCREYGKRLHFEEQQPVSSRIGQPRSKSNARSGNATLNGGSDNDTLVAGSGNDVIAGGDGNSWLTGGTNTACGFSRRRWEINCG